MAKLNMNKINEIVNNFDHAVSSAFPFNKKMMKPSVHFNETHVDAILELRDMPFEAIEIEISENECGDIIIDLFWTRNYDPFGETSWFTKYTDETATEELIRDAMIPWHMETIANFNN